MTIAYWCIVIVSFLPILCAGYGKYKGGFSREANRNTRQFFAQSTGVSARANAAQLNCYESLPVFASAVIIAHITGDAEQATINALAVLYVISRVLFCYCYIADFAFMRSVVWCLGLVCTVGLFVAAV